MRPIGIAGRFGTIVAMVALGSLTTLARSQDLEEITAEGEQAILAQPGLKITGASSPDVTVVEYFDYNCPYCKHVAPTLTQLLAEDTRLAMVYKDWPVLGDASAYAARCALAAGWQDKYFVAHDALLSGRRLTGNDQIEAILKGAGVDIDRLKRDLAAHAPEISALLARNAAEAKALQLDGTPGILVGRQLMPGGADAGFFRKLIAAVRSGRGGGKQSK